MAGPRCLAGNPPPVASWPRRLRRSAKRRIASTRSSFVDSSSASTPGVGEGRAELGLALLGGLLEALAESAVVRVDEELLARLGVLHDQHAEIRQLHFQRVVQAHGDDVVPLREVGERLRPSRRADEIRDDEDERAPRRHRIGGAQELAEVGGADLRARRAVLHPVQEMQHLAPAAPRRDDRVHAIPVEQRADAIAVARQDARQHGDELGRHRLLLQVVRAEVDRRAQVEQEPRGDFALLVVLAHVRRGEARGDVPVDVPHVVAVLVFAEVGEVEPVAAKERPVVAVQHAVEPPDHRPLETAQDRLRRSRRVSVRFGHGSRAASRASARAA